MRELSDEFFIVPLGISVTWSRSGPHPRVRYEDGRDLSVFDRYQIRDAVMDRVPDLGNGDDAGFADADDAAADAEDADAAAEDEDDDFVGFVLGFFVNTSRAR